MKTSPPMRWRPVHDGSVLVGGNDWIKRVSGIIVQSERDAVARVFAAAFGAAVGGATRHAGAAMVAAACRDPRDNTLAGPQQGHVDVLDEVGQKVAVIEAGLRTQEALVGDRPTSALASAIGALRQLNRAINDAKHGDEARRTTAFGATADIARALEQHSMQNSHAPTSGREGPAAHHGAEEHAEAHSVHTSVSRPSCRSIDADTTAATGSPPLPHGRAAPIPPVPPLPQGRAAPGSRPSPCRLVARHPDPCPSMHAA